MVGPNNGESIQNTDGSNGSYLQPTFSDSFTGLLFKGLDIYIYEDICIYIYISILYPCVHIITYRECVFGEATNRMFSMKVDFFVESSHDTAPQILLNSRAKQSRYPEPPTTVPGIPCAKRTESSMD